jgi:hypothetical protein
MIQYIELLWEPLTILFFTIVTFYSLGWLLAKIADLLGIEEMKMMIGELMMMMVGILLVSTLVSFGLIIGTESY